MDLRLALQNHLGQAYRIDRELGGGGMSRVFVAHEARFGRDVVIKVLSPELAQGLSVERFEREILLAASLQQANIVPVLAAGDVDGLPYFTMPFVEGQSLRRLIRDEGLPITEIVTILRDVTKALAHAHARGIVHRDIKPDNVLLSGGTAVVTDFGIAKALAASKHAAQGQLDDGTASLTVIGTSIGSPPYMAPEQVAADPDVDHRADLYSLGCMGYELLTGRSPFAEHGAQRMLAAHLSEPARPVAEVRIDTPPELARLIDRLLAKSPAERPSDAAEVLQSLDGVGTGSTSFLALDRPGVLLRALALYLLAAMVVAVVAKAAVVGIGLPEWTFTGAMAVMLLGLPQLLFTLWVKWTVRQPQSSRTPGGSAAATGTMTSLALRADRHVSLRRTVRGGIYAMSAFVLLVAGYMMTRAMGIGPAASLFASGALENNAKVVIGDLVAAPDDSALAGIVTEAVRAALSQSRAISVIEPADVATLLTEMRQPHNARLDPTTAREVALRGGAAAVLGGRFARAGDGYALSLELTGVTKGAILASVQGVAPETELIKTTDALTRKLRSKIGESLRQVQLSVPLERATTSNLAALQKYSEAVRANDVDGDFDRAVRLAREAVALDSTFALAWRKLGVALTSARRPIAAQDSALARAMHFADRLPPLERNLVEGNFYDFHSDSFDATKALAAYQAAFAIDSTNNTAINALYRLSPDSTLQLHYAELAYRYKPTLRNRLMIVSRRVTVGDTLGAIALLDSVKAASPVDSATPAFLAQAIGVATAQRDWDGAIVLLRQMVTTPNTPDRLNALDQLGRLEQLTGRFGAAREAHDDWGRLTAERGGLDYGPIWEANVNIRFRGKNELGVRQVQDVIRSSNWAETPPRDRGYVDAIILYAQAGRVDLADALLAQWQRDDPEVFSNPIHDEYLELARRAIAFAKADYPAALASARVISTTQYYAAVGLAAMGKAFDKMGQTDSVIAVYQRFLALSTREQLAYDVAADELALIHKRLGEIYESRGDRARAIEHDAAFVDLWRNADPEMQPVVAEVRGRLADLQAAEAP